MQKIFVDTNILIDYSKDIFNKYDQVYLCDIVLSELDKLKYSTDGDRKYQARAATRTIEENEDKIKFIIYEDDKYGLLFSFDKNNNDNKIISVFKNLYDNDNEILGISNDLNFRHKCRCLNIPVVGYGNKNNNTGYKGYIELNLNSYEINQLYDDLNEGVNKHNLLENQYVIIHEKGKRKSSEYIYRNGLLEQLKLPNSKYIKGANGQQRCALDLLNNTNIPIKIVAGTYGSGKTYLTTKMGLYHVFEKGNYGHILLLRNPLGSGEEVGYLRGDKQEKISDFFRCVEQYIDPSIIKDKDINEYIKKDIPYYIKGMSYGSTYVFVDEAEDMDLKILKLIGSRIESDSCVVFCGDYKQSEPKYKRDNGLYQLIEKLKGNPLVGIVVLDEDVRSEASKVFADI